MTAPAAAPSRTELRKFGFTTAAIVAALFGLALPWLFGRAWARWPWIVAVLLALPAGFAPALLATVHRAWTAVGSVLGWINTRILLAAAFYLVVMPVGVVMRLVGRDPMRRAKSVGPSYRQPSTERAAEDMERPF